MTQPLPRLPGAPMWTSGAVASAAQHLGADCLSQSLEWVAQSPPLSQPGQHGQFTGTPCHLRGWPQPRPPLKSNHPKPRHVLFMQREICSIKFRFSLRGTPAPLERGNSRTWEWSTGTGNTPGPVLA